MARIRNNKYLVGERIKVIAGPYKATGNQLSMVLGTVEKDSTEGLTCFIRLDRALSVGDNLPKQHIEIQKHFISHVNVMNPRHEVIINENVSSDSSDDSDDSDVSVQE